MNFGDLRSIIHRGELPPLFATLPEDQQGYAMRMAGEKFAARTERLRLAEWLVYAEDPLSLDTRKKIDPALDPLLRWYSCDVAEEAMRMHGNGDSRSLRSIEVARAYVLGKASKEDLRRARKDAFDATKAAYNAARAADAAGAAPAAHAAKAAYGAAYATAYAVNATAGAANAAACAASYTASYAAAADAASIYTIYHHKQRILRIDWFRAYLVRWIEEGNWWEVPS